MAGEASAPAAQERGEKISAEKVMILFLLLLFCLLALASTVILFFILKFYRDMCQMLKRSEDRKHD
jgi:ABC-type polysaccharide/polyol phosphate export permease